MHGRIGISPHRDASDDAPIGMNVSLGQTEWWREARQQGENGASVPANEWRTLWQVKMA